MTSRARSGPLDEKLKLHRCFSLPASGRDKRPLCPCVCADSAGPFRLRASGLDTWRLSSGLVLANNVIALVRTIVKNEGALAQANEWNLRHIMWAIEVVCLAALVANVFAVFKEFASALYLTFLVARVAQVAMMFLRFFEIAFTREST